MQKHGFTLAELLGVITVLGLIALIVFPNVNKSIKNSKKNLYDRQVELIENNARKWGGANSDLLPDSGAYYLELSQLINSGYISNKEIKDPRDDSTMNGCVVIGYDEEYKQYKYEYVENSCSEIRGSCPSYEIMGKNITNGEVACYDPDKNPRYVGTNPNNYVMFNNELWRIIGMFNGQAKIIRNEFYSESIAWDEEEKYGGHGDYGWNDWSIATLQTELNGTYLNSINEVYKNMIDESHVWNLGGIVNDLNFERAYVYNSERGNNVYEGRPTKWTGAIGLMYASDYGYSTSATNSECDETMQRWAYPGNVENCKNNSWLYKHSNGQWTILVGAINEGIVYQVSSKGTVGLTELLQLPQDPTDYSKAPKMAASPSLYLKSDVEIIGGDGTETNPFELSGT